MTRRTWSIAAVLLAGAAIVVATYRHLERAMRREPEPWVEPYPDFV